MISLTPTPFERLADKLEQRAALPAIVHAADRSAIRPPGHRRRLPFAEPSSRIGRLIGHTFQGRPEGRRLLVHLLVKQSFDGRLGGSPTCGFCLAVTCSASRWACCAILAASRRTLARYSSTRPAISSKLNAMGRQPCHCSFCFGSTFDDRGQGISSVRVLGGYRDVTWIGDSSKKPSGNPPNLVLHSSEVRQAD